jgi:uncharacterized membrane protein
MEGNHPVKPGGQPAEPEQATRSGADAGRQDRQRRPIASLLGAVTGRLRSARLSPAGHPPGGRSSAARPDDRNLPGEGEAFPHLSTVLGPLPATVSDEQTRDLNDAVHRILIAGLILSTALLLTGLILDAINGRSLPTQPVPPGEALSRALQLRGSGFLSLGLLVLVSTPIVRVLGSAIVFLWERDWRYVAITIFVLLVMLTSVVLGGG